MSVPTAMNTFVIETPDFVSTGFCQRVIDRAHDLGFHAATVTSEQGTAVTPDIRNNDRVIFDDPQFADQLWQLAAPYFTDIFKGHRAVRLNERFRVYRYGPGQFFDWHQDGEFRNTDAEVSKFTMMIYLNDAFEGGGTSFADVFSPHVFQDFTIEPATGKALFFHHPLSHRGDPILAGEKYVLRTDVMFRPATE